MNQIIIRADSSYDLGSGHVMRCLTLADELRSMGANIIFFCKNTPGNMIPHIQSKGYEVWSYIQESEDNYFYWDIDANCIVDKMKRNFIHPGWLIVDHYGIDYKWENKVRPYVSNIMVIDDLADRKHDCDVILDQNFYEDPDDRYNHLVSIKCKTFIGPEYVLLRPEFKDPLKKDKFRNGHIANILVFFGGSDPTNETVKTLRALKEVSLINCSVDVVVGASNPNNEIIKDLVNTASNMRYHYQVNNISDLMYNADLAIGAGGTATWERCYLGLPAIVIITAENQVKAISLASKKGAILCLGHSTNVTEKTLLDAVNTLSRDPARVKEMSITSKQIMNSSEVSQYTPVATYIMGGCDD